MVRFEIGKHYLLPGYLALIIGGTVTIGTIAGFLNGGPLVVFYYSPLIYGIVSVGTGHLRLRQYPL